MEIKTEELKEEKREEEGIPVKRGDDGDDISAAVRETVSHIVDVICSQVRTQNNYRDVLNGRYEGR